MIKTIFFDFGNTLVDYHRGLLSDEEKDLLGLLQIKAKLKEAGNEIAYEHLVASFYLPWINKFPERRTRKAEHDVLAMLRKSANIDQEEAEELMVEFFEPSCRFAEVLEGVPALLKMIKERERK